MAKVEKGYIPAEYHEGPKALERFERTAKALFQVKKSDLKEPPKPTRKHKTASKD